MTLTLNDTIELLKAILEECGIDSIVLIISLIVVGWTVSFPSFNAIKTHRISFALSPLSYCFYENFDKIYQEIPCKSSFFPLSFCLSPSYFCLLKGWKVLSEPLFLASKSIFRSLRSRSLRVIKVFQYLKSPLRFAMKIAFAKKGGLWVKIKLFFGKV